MGPYCRFCDRRCFIPLPANTPPEALDAYGTSTIVATCPAGQAFELNRTGWNLDRIRAAPTPAAATPAPAGCVNCGTIQTPADDRTTLNIDRRCRECQKAVNVPRPWRRAMVAGYEYGCYFPSTDLTVSEMGGRGTGEPSGVKWLAPARQDAAAEKGDH